MPYACRVKTLCRICGHRPQSGAEACDACGSPRIVRHPELDDLAIAHLDCDAFYAAIEKRDRPELADVPVIVGGRHRGVVAACCYIARSFGVRSAMPMFRALKLCPEAHVIPPDMGKYVATGNEVRALMQNVTPLVETLSIDEAFMDLSGTSTLHGGSPARTLARLANQIGQELGITVSIGLSYNKFLAKIASDLDKPCGFAVIGRGEARRFLADKPVSLLWGVGDATRRRLARDGITLIGDLARMDEAELISRYGKIGRRFFRFSRGEDDRAVEPEGETRSISSETTLHDDTAELARLRRILWQLSENVSERMRKAGLASRGVTLKLKTSNFRIITRNRHLQHPTRSAEEIFLVGEALLGRETDGRTFRLIGIGVHDFVDSGDTAFGDLFDHARKQSNVRVDEALDAVRQRFGRDSLVRGRAFGDPSER
ncbi:MAG: DNA polymerase IV [bacterium]|nr:DNA polymerase IV [bacterium]